MFICKRFFLQKKHKIKLVNIKECMEVLKCKTSNNSVMRFESNFCPKYWIVVEFDFF